MATTIPEHHSERSRRPLPILARAELTAKHALRRLMRLGRLHSCFQQTSFGRMHYYDSKPSGNGRAVLFLHGLGSSSVSLLPLAALMRRHCRVIIPDVMHFSGLSEPLKEKFSLTDHVDTLYEFFEALDLESVDLFGHSVGGAGAMRLAIEYPQRTRSLALVNPGGFSFGFERIREDLLRLRGGRSERLYEQIVGGMPLLQALPVRAVGARIIHHALGRQGVRDFLESISEKDFIDGVVREVVCPTLLLWGDDDRFLPVEIAWHIVSELDSVQAFFVKGGSHLLCIDSPYRVYTSLRRFLGYGRAWPARLRPRSSPFVRIRGGAGVWPGALQGDPAAP
jgi:pimeloyl-ACP methyl ester carboxylesterase